MPVSFPAVLVEPVDPAQARATAAMRLTAIMPLRPPVQNESVKPEEEAQAGAVSFVRSIAGWTSSVLELRYVFRPNLAQPSAGLTEVYFVLHEYASADKVRQALLRRYGSLVALLQAYYPVAVFEPLADEAGLRELLHPKLHTEAWAIRRNRVCVDLQQPGAPWPVGAVGFGIANKYKSGTPEVFDYCFPWVTSLDAWRAPIEALHVLSEPAYLTVRLRARDPETAPFVPEFLAQVTSCEEFESLRRETNPALVQQTLFVRAELQTRLAHLRDCAVDLSVVLASRVPIDASLAAAWGDAITRAVARGYKDKNDTYGYFSGGYDVVTVATADALRPDFQVEPQPFTAAQAACAFRLPYPTPMNTFHLPVKLFKTTVAGLQPVQDGDLVLGANEHRNFSQSVSLTSADRLRHTYLVGMTGCGKSTLLESMILQDIRAGRGVAFIDPHGETIESLLGKIPRERIKDVMLIDPLDYERPIGFNLIACQSDFERDFIVGQFWEIFDTVYNMTQNGGPMFEQYMRIFLNILMGDDGPREAREHVPTILEIDAIFWDKNARLFLQEGCDPDRIKDFMQIIEEASGEHDLKNMGPWVLSKFGRFLHDKALARMVGQSKNVIDFEAVLREKKIVLFKLGKGRFSSTVCDILAGVFVARMLSAVFSRANVEPAKRTEYFLYVDEFQNLVSDAFGEMLAEVRKYKLGLVLAHQYTDQLVRGRDREKSLLPAVLGNVGTIVSFRVGAGDAKKLAPSFEPTYNANDLINLPNYQAYVRTSAGGRLLQPFSLVTRVPAEKFEPSVAQAVREHSRMTYGRPVAEVDAEIKARKKWLRGNSAEDADDKVDLKSLFTRG